MDKIRLEIVTPHGPTFSGDAEEVTASGSEGDFGVLPGHAPFMTTLKIGILVAKIDGKPHYFFVNSGYAEVTTDKMLILADSAERAEDIDVQRAIAAKERAEERIRKQENIDYTRAESSLQRAMIRIQLAEKRVAK